MGKGHTHVGLSLGILLACCACSFGLDPSVDVSQYAHTAWKIREGFATGTDSGAGGLVLRTTMSYRSLVAGRDGTLWLGTAKGLASWKDNRLTQFPQLAGFDIYTLLQDHEGTVWAAGVTWEAGLSQPGKLCAIKDGDVHCDGGDGTFSFGVTAAYEDSRGNLWLGAGNAIFLAIPTNSVCSFFQTEQIMMVPF